jgi:hypothetical protein
LGSLVGDFESLTRDRERHAPPVSSVALSGASWTP